MKIRRAAERAPRASDLVARQIGSHWRRPDSLSTAWRRTLPRYVSIPPHIGRARLFRQAGPDEPSGICFHRDETRSGELELKDSTGGRLIVPESAQLSILAGFDQFRNAAHAEGDYRYAAGERFQNPKGTTIQSRRRQERVEERQDRIEIGNSAKEMQSSIESGRVCKSQSEGVAERAGSRAAQRAMVVARS